MRYFNQDIYKLMQMQEENFDDGKEDLERRIAVIVKELKEL